MPTPPPLSDGTCSLRPYTEEDLVTVANWLSGPRSKERRSTDGGPSSTPDAVDQLIGDLKHHYLYIVEVDGQRCGLASIDALAKQHGILTLILEQESYWHQGIGDRVVGLLCTFAFEHEKFESLSVRNIPEQAEAGRVVWENAGFSQVSRIPHQGQVTVNFTLTRAAYTAHEQRVLLVRHARHALDAEQRAASHQDLHLDAIGRAQSEALKECSLLYGIKSCVCADQLQARSTAERCFTRECAFVLDEDWRGQDLGSWQDKAYADMSKNEEGLYDDPPLGEKNQVFQKRIESALAKLPMNEDLAIVTCSENIAGLLRSLQPDLLGAPGLRTGTGIAPASITELRRGPEGWRVIRIADDRHLRARRATEELGRVTASD